MIYNDNMGGFSYSPDRRNDRVNHYNTTPGFINANGNRQTGHYYSIPSAQTRAAAAGWYDGAGRYHKD